MTLDPVVVVMMIVMLVEHTTEGYLPVGSNDDDELLVSWFFGQNKRR